MKRMVFLTLLTASAMVYAKAPMTRLVYLDGSVLVVEGDVKLDHNMLAVKTPKGKQMLLSKGLIDWGRTSETAPEVYRMAYPEGIKDLKKPQKVEVQEQPEQRIVINNKALEKAMKDRPADEHYAELEMPEKPAEQASITTAPASTGPVIEVIGRQNRIDLRAHVEKDRYVMFDFYADWCGPCRQLTPQLEALVRQYPDRIALKKIDIVKWGTPVAQQYKINSIPHVKLYSPDGQLISEGNGGKVLRKAQSLMQK